jgi:hypothetical protein
MSTNDTTVWWKESKRSSAIDAPLCIIHGGSQLCRASTAHVAGAVVGEMLDAFTTEGIEDKLRASEMTARVNQYCSCFSA